MKIVRWVPGLATLTSYKVSFLPHDLAAGLTLGAVMVPVAWPMARWLACRWPASMAACCR
jgi:MFS superfamily sulfate permease-like transporter